MKKHIVKEVTLGNGAKGLFIHIPGATVMSFDISFRAGEYLVDPGKWEVPHLMEHVILGANELIPKARDFQKELEKNGAYSNATTGVYDITYEAEAADFEWDRVLGLLLTAISKPLFLEEEFWAEYGNVQEEITARSNNHFRRLSLEIRKNLGLLAKTDAERLELMSNVAIEDIREHYQKTHVAPNMRFVVAGRLNAQRQAALEKMLDSVDLNEGVRFDLPIEHPRKVANPVYVSNDTVDNLYFYIDTFMKRRMSDPESDALSLVNTLLTETLYSRILGTARERGLVYGMSSGISQSRNTSNWWFGAQVSEKNASALFEIIVTEILKVMGGDIKISEITAAKRYALGRFQRSAQTVSGTAAAYATRYFFDEVIEDYEKIPKRIRSIRKSTMLEAAQSLFQDNVGCFGVLGGCDEAFVRKLHSQLDPLWSQTSSIKKIKK